MVGRMYPTEARPYLKRMATEDIGPTVAAEAYERWLKSSSILVLEALAQWLAEAA